MKIVGYQAVVDQILQGFQDTELGVGEGEAALEIDCIGRLDGTVCAQLYGGTGNKGAGGHDHLRVVAGHVPGFGGHEAVHGSRSLNALTEGDHAFGRAEGNGLNDIVSALLSVRQYRKADLLIQAGGEDGSF